jgi:hypothetical protein
VAGGVVAVLPVLAVIGLAVTLLLTRNRLSDLLNPRSYYCQLTAQLSANPQGVAVRRRNLFGRDSGNRLSSSALFLVNVYY